MRLSAQADYAVVMMRAAARQCGSVRLNATMLSSAGLIESSRGTGGGFRLARPPAAITLADIVEAIEGPIAMTPCVEHGRHDCAIEGSCDVRPHWDAVNGAVRGALAGVTLSNLIGAHEPARLGAEA